jgi:DNA anti-recombination protein RmuC
LSREEAKKEIEPFIAAFNEKSKEIAKKYKMKAKTINFAGWVR